MPLRFAFGDTFAPLPNNEIAFSRDSLIPGVFPALTTMPKTTIFLKPKVSAKSPGFQTPHQSYRPGQTQMSGYVLRFLGNDVPTENPRWPHFTETSAELPTRIAFERFLGIVFPQIAFQL